MIFCGKLYFVSCCFFICSIHFPGGERDYSSFGRNLYWMKQDYFFCSGSVFNKLTEATQEENIKEISCKEIVGKHSDTFVIFDVSQMSCYLNRMHCTAGTRGI